MNDLQHTIVYSIMLFDPRRGDLLAPHSVSYRPKITDDQNRITVALNLRSTYVYRSDSPLDIAIVLDETRLFIGYCQRSPLNH